MKTIKRKHCALAEKCGVGEAAIGDRVNALLRRRYSLSEELGILRRRDEDPAAFRAYYEYAEACKKEARAEWEGVL